MQFFEYLCSLGHTKIVFGLDGVRTVLARLGNPHLRYRTVLVGGTNGKGSVAAMIAAVMKRQGHIVGLYTSPHLSDFSERIRVDDVPIPVVDIERFGREIQPFATDASLTYFECATVLAFHYFARRSVTCAVVEVGMGGRLDATNVVDPIVSVITNISREHKAYLGTTLADIADEKAGIVKERGVCVTGVTQPVVRARLEKKAAETGSSLYILGRDFNVRRNRRGGFSYTGRLDSFRDISLPLPGRHQVQNAGLALAALEVFSEKAEEPLSEVAVKAGLRSVVWEGRIEIVRRAPLTILDGGHNPAGVAVLSRFLSEECVFERLFVVFGVLDDKEYRPMLKLLARRAHTLVLTTPPGERARRARDMRQYATRYCRNVFVIDTPAEAVRFACRHAGRNDCICVTGSLYLVGEIRKDVSAPFCL